MKVRISIFVYVFALVMTFLGYFTQLLSYFAAVVLHELAHAESAKHKGYVLNEFRLMPYGAALIGEFEDVNWRDECRIAAAGPLCNVVLAILSVALWWLIPSGYYFTEGFVYANLSLAAVNLLPVYPLDGGRIALALISRKTPRQKAYKRLRIAGIFMSVVFAAAFVASCFFVANPSFLSMSAFILFSTVIPDNRCRYQRLYELSNRAKRVKRGLPVREIAVSRDAPVSVLFGYINANYYTEFRIVDGGMKTLGKISEAELERVEGCAYCGKAGELLVGKSPLKREILSEKEL